MTKLLEEAVEKVKQLPGSAQDIAAEFLMSFAEEGVASYQLTPEQVAEVELARREVREGKIASDDEMAELWTRFGH